MLLRTLLACLLLAANCVHAQNPRVLIDTDRGPMLFELDIARAPNTVANFLAYVDSGAYNGMLVQRVVPGFVVQTGRFRENGSEIPQRPAITSERNNGLSNTAGTIAMALSGNPPNVNSATSDFFINTGNNATTLDANFTVFGRLVSGQRTLNTIATTAIFVGSEQPIRIPLVRRVARVAAGEFAILPAHTASWYDPNNSGKGFLIEVAHAAGTDANPLLLVSWYDFFEGRQIWTIGAAPFAWGAHQVEVPMLITSGAQFGAAFRPNQVVSNANWGRLTVRFTSCANGVFSYTSIYGDGVIPVQSLTIPTNEVCAGQ